MYTASVFLRYKMQKLKLLSSLKEKKRYLVYEIISEGNIFNAEYKIIENLNHWLGSIESSKAGINLIQHSKQKNRGIIKINNTYLHKIKLGLSLIKQIDN